MDPRGYNLPFYGSHRPRTPAHVVWNSRNPFEYRQNFLDQDPSLPDGPEDMPQCTRSPKKESSRAGSGLDDRHQELKKPLAIIRRNQNSGIDVALRNLNHEVSASLKMLQAFVECFEVEIEPLRGWAEDYTLNTVWRNKVRDKRREKHDREKFDGVATRIADSRAAVKCAVKNARTLKEAWDDKHEIERQIRTAKKTLLYCDEIIHLAERAASERLACKQLVFELEEVMGLLDGQKHPWIYGEDMVEEQADLKQPKSTARRTKGEKLQGDGTGSEDGNETEKQDEVDTLDQA